MVEVSQQQEFSTANGGHPGTHDGGSHPTDTHITELGRGVQAKIRDIAARNRTHIGEGEGKDFPDFESFQKWYLEVNDYRHVDTKVRCTGKDFHGDFERANMTIYGPKGWDLRDIGLNCTAIPVILKTNPNVPMLGASPPPPPAPEASVEKIDFNEYTRQGATASDGTFWTPDSQMHAYETLARTGLIPAFTKKYFALTSIAARDPSIGAGTSGLEARKVNGNVAGDHLREGDRNFENSESRQDNSVAALDATRGQQGIVGQIFTGNRDTVGEAGHIKGVLPNAELAEGAILPNGTYVRDRNFGPLALAYGGDYRKSLIFGIGLEFGNLGDLPVGGVHSSPREQYLSDVEARRYGIIQAYTNTSVNKVGGFDDMFSDEQTLISGAQETPDRLDAFTHAINARKEFAAGMRAMDAATDPLTKQAAAEHALIALRDYEQNAQVKRDDAMHIPLEQLRTGVNSYIVSQGVTVDQARIAAAPRLQLTDMSPELLTSLQDYDRLKDSRYQGINPGQTNAAYKATERLAYRVKNSYDQTIANRRVPELPEAEMVGASYATHKAINENDASIDVIAHGIGKNRELANAFAHLLTDMPRNPTHYGFQSTKEAIAYLETNYIQGDKALEAQLLTRGDSSIINSLLPISSDDPYPATRLDIIAPALEKRILENRGAYRDTMERATSPAYAIDRDGKSDGRRQGLTMLQALGSEIPAEGTAEGQDTGVYKDLVPTLSAGKEPVVRHGVLAATVFAEAGASGRSVNAAEELDRNITTAQYGSLAAQGRNIDVAGDSDLPAVTQRLKGKADAAVLVNNDADARAIFDAGRSGNTASVFDIALRSQNARELGKDKIAVLGLAAHPALFKDLGLVTILREPSAFNGVIAELHSMGDSTEVGRYDSLARKLERASKAATTYKVSKDPSDRAKAVDAYGEFYQDMEADPTANSSALRVSAMEKFIHIVGTSDASALMMDTARQNPTQFNAVLKSIPDGIAATDGVSTQPHGRMSRSASSVPANIDGDDVYKSILKFPTDDKGRVQSKGWFSFLGIDNPKVTADDQALDEALGIAPDATAVGSNASAPYAKSDRASPGSVAQGTTPPGAVTATTLPAATTNGANGKPLVATNAATAATVAAQGLVVKGVEAGNALRTNPIIYLGTNEKGANVVDGIAAWLKANFSKDMPPNTDWQAEAKKINDRGLLTTAQNGAGQVFGSVNSKAIESTLINASKTAEGWGIDSRLLYLLIPHGGPSNPNIGHFGGGGCPGGPTCGGGGVGGIG